MQAPDQNDISKQLELSEVWRQLLGQEAQAFPVPPSLDAAIGTDADNQEGVPVLSHDPWNHLVHEHGVQVVDLLLAHIHTAQTSGEENDVEHALNIMQENKPEK